MYHTQYNNAKVDHRQDLELEKDTPYVPLTGVLWGAHQEYRQVSNIRRTKSQHLKDSHTVLRLSLPNPLKPDGKSRMKM